MSLWSGNGGTRESAWRWYLLASAPALVVYFLLPSGIQDIYYQIVGLAAVLAILVGTRLHRPSHRLPWYFIAAGQLAAVTGDAVYAVYEQVLHRSPFPSVADVFYLGSYPLLVVGLVAIVRNRGSRGDRSELIDALVVTIGAGMVSWVFLMAPYAHDSNQPLFDRLVSISYPLADLLLMAVAARLVFTPGARTASYRFLGASLVLTAVADTGYLVLTLADSYHSGHMIDLGWLLAYTCWALAALHPSMGEVTTRAEAEPPRLEGRRLVLAAVGGLMSPAMLVVQAFTQDRVDVPVIAAGSALLFLLVLARVAGLLRALSRTLHRVQGHADQERALRSDLERSVAREAVLRRAGAALVAATDREQIRQAALDALAALSDETPARAWVDLGRQVLDCLSDPTRRALTAGHTMTLAEPDRVALLNKLTSSSSSADHPVADGEETWGLLAPLFIDGQLSGALVAAGRPDPPDHLPANLASLASQVALALERTRLAEALLERRSQERFRSLVQNSSDLVTVVDMSGLIRYQSPSASPLLGYDGAGLVGRRLESFVHFDDWARVQHHLESLLSGGPGATAWFEFRVLHRKGSSRHLECTATNMADDPYLAGILLHSRDITSRKDLETELSRQAYSDPLTGLANRTLFVERVAQALAHLHDSRNLAVLFCDLDDFKTVNDSLGHAAGDELLKQVAGRLVRCVRPSDTVARFGGDEFAVLLSEVDRVESAVAVAGRILETLSHPLWVSVPSLPKTQLVVEASIGIVLGNVGNETADELLHNADLAMYMAKGGGKGRYEVFEPGMQEASLQRLELLAGLGRGLPKGKL